MTRRIKRILIMAGGTGGHVFPALAIARECLSQGFCVHWLGTTSGIEVKLVKQENIAYHRLSVKGLRGKKIRKLFFAPFLLCSSFLKSFWVMLRVRPDVVIGLGGYVSGPGAVAAKLCRKRLVIHEQNSLPGLTNRILSRYAHCVLHAFPDTFSNLPQANCIGNPIREDICALPSPDVRFSHRRGPLRLLVMGGSLGAASFNEVLPQALHHMNIPVDVLHQTGKHTIDKVRDAYDGYAIAAQVLPFIDDMAGAYGWADLIVCRAGALTISELMTVGLASILVPYPYAVDDHQRENARYLVSREAALMLTQTEFNPISLSNAIISIAPRQTLLTMANAAYTLRSQNVTKRAVALCLGQE